MPKRASKVAISLPAALLAEADQACQERGETRSEFIRRAIAAQLAQDRARADTERYVGSYLADPETETDNAPLLSLGLGALARDRWE